MQPNESKLKEPGALKGRYRSPYEWCSWTNWINACREDPYHVIELTPSEMAKFLVDPSRVNPTKFRNMCHARAKQAGCKAHVKVNWGKQIIRLQFCWSTEANNHYSIHERPLPNPSWEEMAEACFFDPKRKLLLRQNYDFHYSPYYFAKLARDAALRMGCGVRVTVIDTFVELQFYRQTEKTG